MRRQLISQNNFTTGFSDGVNPLHAPATGWYEGSCNQLILADNLTRPFKGWYSKGSGSGCNYSCLIGDVFGGLSNYGSTTGQGNVLQDYSKTLFFIGSGSVNKAGTLVQKNCPSFSFTPSATVVDTSTGLITYAGHGLYTGQPVTLSAGTTIMLGLSAATNYWAINVSSSTFKLATSLANAQGGTAVTGGTSGTGTQTVSPGQLFTSANTTTGAITVTTHNLVQGQAVYFSTAGTLPFSMTAATAYWVAVVVDANTIKVANSYANAMAGTFLTGGSIAGNSYIRSGSLTSSVVTGIRASTSLQVASLLTADYFYSYVDQAGLATPDAPVVAVPATPSGSYTGVINGAVNFKIAGIRDRSHQGSDIDDPSAPVKSVSSTASAVVVPNNKTVQITFPDAKVGQTHWAVFSTQEGFGGTGDFYRLGYRTSSDASAVWYYGISETTVAAATNRTLEFDYRTGDLLPETAWIQDYPPLAGTHCVRLENVMSVLGCLDGSVICVSLPNFYESYNPFHLLYLPEAVTAVLHRQVDNYAIIGCRNSIHAIQYVGYRGGDLPSATITTLNPEVGIAYEHNWAMGGGSIALFLEGAGIAIMSPNGTIDFEFGKEVHRFTSGWTASATTVAFNPATRSFVWGNGDSSVSYCLESGAWSTPVYTSDAGVTGTWTSGINAQGELVATLTNAGVQTAYSYDNNTSTTRMPIVSITNWNGGQDTGRAKNIYEVQVDIENGANVECLIAGVHQNLLKTYQRGCSLTSGSANLTGTFNAGITGMWAALSAANIGNLTFSSVSGNIITITSHGLFTGQSVTLTTTGSLPTGLAVSTTYYVIVTGVNTIQLASTLANARANPPVPITLSSAGSGTNKAVLNFIICKLTYVNTTTASMTDPYTGATKLAAASANPVFALLGQYFFPCAPVASTPQSLYPLRPRTQNARTWALSTLMFTDATTGSTLGVATRGTESGSSVVRVN